MSMDIEARLKRLPLLYLVMHEQHKRKDEMTTLVIKIYWFVTGVPLKKGT